VTAQQVPALERGEEVVRQFMRIGHVANMFGAGGDCRGEDDGHFAPPGADRSQHGIMHRPRQ
jgi:hypothetical protein